MDVREKLVELIEKASYECDEGTRDLYDMREVADGIADFLIANGVTVQEWISVEDRLPEETGQYLTVKKRIAPDDFGGNKTDIVIIRFFVDDGFRMPIHIPDWINKKINEEVTHWMPMPQPPKGE